MPLKRCIDGQQYKLFFLTCGPAIESSEDFQWFLKELKPIRTITTKEVGKDGYPHFHAILKFPDKVRWINMNRMTKNWLSAQIGVMDVPWKVNADWRHGDYGMKNAEAVMEQYIRNPTKIKQVGDVLELESIEKELFDKLMFEWMHKCSRSDFREMYSNCSAATKELASVKAIYNKFYGTMRKRRQLSAYEMARDRMRTQESLSSGMTKDDVLAKIQKVCGEPGVSQTLKHDLPI
jgi:hypothetical protein